MDHIYRANRVPIESLSCNDSNFNQFIEQTVPKTIDGYLFNLIKIVEDIGYNPYSPYIRYPQDNETKNRELLNIILNLGGAYGPLLRRWHSRIDKQYFQRWYLDKCSHSVPTISYQSKNDVNQQIAHKTDDCQISLVFPITVSKNSASKKLDDQYCVEQIQQIYGLDDIDTISSTLSQCSSIDLKDSSFENYSSSTEN